MRKARFTREKLALQEIEMEEELLLPLDRRCSSVTGKKEYLMEHSLRFLLTERVKKVHIGTANTTESVYLRCQMEQNNHSNMKMEK